MRRCACSVRGDRRSKYDLPALDELPLAGFLPAITLCDGWDPPMGCAARQAFRTARRSLSLSIAGGSSRSRLFIPSGWRRLPQNR
jgi:hypothetical protein